MATFNKTTHMLGNRPYNVVRTDNVCSMGLRRYELLPHGENKVVNWIVVDDDLSSEDAMRKAVKVFFGKEM